MPSRFSPATPSNDQSMISFTTKLSVSLTKGGNSGLGSLRLPSGRNDGSTSRTIHVASSPRHASAVGSAMGNHVTPTPRQNGVGGGVGGGGSGSRSGLGVTQLYEDLGNVNLGPYSSQNQVIDSIWLIDLLITWLLLLSRTITDHTHTQVT